MTFSLIGIGRGPSAADRVLAAQLQASAPDLDVALLDINPAAGERQAQLDRALEWLQELGPTWLGLCCTHRNVGFALELVRRAHRLLSGLRTVLGGPEAAARRDELSAQTWVHHVLGPEQPAAQALGQLLGLATRPARCRADAPYGDQLDGLLGQARRHGPVVLAPTWGGDHSLALHLHALPAVRRMEPRVAAARLLPLLRAGVAVRLADPGLTADPEGLRRLLTSLGKGGAEHLSLELPDRALSRPLVALLLKTGPGAIQLELSGVASGELDPRWMALLLRDARPGSVSGALTFGRPGDDASWLGAAVDRCLAQGVERLRMTRLCAPADSPLRRSGAHPGLLLAPSPPYEVLQHAAISAAELTALARFAALFHQVSAALSGTGLLRAMSIQTGSVSELVQGLCDELAIRGVDPLVDPLPAAPDRLFIDYLHQHLGLDLRPQRREDRLRRVVALSVSWDDSGQRTLLDDATGRTAQVGWGAVELVDKFHGERSVEEICDQLVGRVPTAQRAKLRRDLHRTVDRLASMEFLLPAGSTREGEGERPFGSLEEFDYHYRMLADATRVEAYRQAISKAVRPGDHVVEIGTGSGILAVLAAQAGARVTAIERYPVLNLARQVAQHSGMADRITLIRGRADQVTLPRRGDVLISEIVGNRILNEGLLEATLDARQRLLRPGARMIPRRLVIKAELGCTSRFNHLDAEFATIGERFGVSLEPLAAWFRRQLTAGEMVWELGPRDEDYRALSGAVKVIELDLHRFREPAFSRKVRLRASSDCHADAVVLSFQLQLHPGVTLSSRDQRELLHWCRPVYMLPAPLACARRQPVSVRVSYQAHGEIRVALEPDAQHHANDRASRRG